MYYLSSLFSADSSVRNLYYQHYLQDNNAVTPERFNALWKALAKNEIQVSSARTLMRNHLILFIEKWTTLSKEKKSEEKSVEGDKN